MYELSRADRIWNRACGDDPLRNLAGDRALRGMLQAHGLVMNGGVLHAIELLDGDDLAEALDGYRYYEFEKVASLLIRAKQLFEADEKLDQYESELDREYELVVPSDSSLFEQFRNHLLSNPAAYAALCTKDES